MSPFKQYEREVVDALLAPRFEPAVRKSIFDSAVLVDYYHSSVGYFLTVRHDAISSERIVCDRPLVEGKDGNMRCGFLVLLEGGELCLECHGYDDDVPADVRDRSLEITVVKQDSPFPN